LHDGKSYVGERAVAVGLVDRVEPMAETLPGLVGRFSEGGGAVGAVGGGGSVAGGLMAGRIKVQRLKLNLLWSVADTVCALQDEGSDVVGEGIVVDGLVDRDSRRRRLIRQRRGAEQVTEVAGRCLITGLEPANLFFPGCRLSRACTHQGLHSDKPGVAYDFAPFD